MSERSDATVRRSIEVDLPPDEVWELLVDDEERAGWFGGPTTLDPVPGGEGAFTEPDGTRREATVDRVEPGRHLSWTWWPGDDDGAPTQVHIDLRPTPGGTTVTVTEVPLTPVARSCTRTARPGFPLLDLEATCLFRAAGLVLV